jgi:hypothetical protein
MPRGKKHPKTQMGAAASHHDPRHVRIWNNLNAITSAASRLQMLTTLLEAQEYVNAAKRAGIYADLLGWASATRRGEFFAWPTPAGAPPVPRVNSTPFLPPAAMTKAPPQHAPPTALARVAPPKRALDVLHECYELLGLDDSTPLTHERLRAAYKRAAVRAHPDKGGSAEAFDAINRAFGYVQEVLNKLLPQTATDGGDPRFTVVVSPESAARARGDYVSGSVTAAPSDALRIEDAPQIALNPKKLDLALFNKLFEENRLPDPDADGYGDWLKSAEGRNDMAVARGAISKSNFNTVFVESARASTSTATPKDALSKYKPPSDLVLSPGFGVTLGSDRPDQYTKATGSLSDGHGLAYTDLKHAYGDGSTFSQEVVDTGFLGLDKSAALPGRATNMEAAKREYGAAPRALSPEEAAAVAAFDRARETAEAARRARVAARDVDAERAHTALKGRLLIRE